MTEFLDKTIPKPGNRPDHKSDAEQVAEVLLKDGVVIIPTEQGYGLLASDPTAIDRSFAAKQRDHNHPLGLIGNHQLSTEMLIMSEKNREILRVWTQELDMPIGVIAPYRENHPLLVRLGEDVLAKHTKNGTIAMFVGGPIMNREIVRLVLAEGRLVLGSSANLTGSGQKFRVGDIEPEVKDAADLIVDYGIQRAHVYGVGTTLVDFGSEEVKILRFGSCYEMFKDYMDRFWNVQLPEGPPVPRVPVESERA